MSGTVCIRRPVKRLENQLLLVRRDADSFVFYFNLKLNFAVWPNRGHSKFHFDDIRCLRKLQRVGKQVYYHLLHPEQVNLQSHLFGQRYKVDRYLLHLSLQLANLHDIRNSLVDGVFI